MITLYGTGPMFGLPHASPFATKTELLLKMSGLAYQNKSADIRKAPKGKIPWIDDNGEIIPDSSFIRQHLETKYNADFSGGYDARTLGIGYAVEKMMENHYYYFNVQNRWLDGDNFNRGPAHFFAAVPALLRPLIKRVALANVRKRVLAHGVGQHTPEQRLLLVKQILQSVDDVIGESTYFLGDTVSGTDAVVFAFLQSAACPIFDSPYIAATNSHPRLVAYIDRMAHEFFPD